MLRYRCWPCLGLLLLVGGCSVPSARDNADAAASLVQGKVPAALVWRRDPEADRSARERAEQLLAGGLTVHEAIALAFLASPSLQLALEQLEISRADLVAASRPTNPVIVAGSREPGGDLAPYYPDRTISIGVLQNLISLLSIPDRRAYARHNLERARLEVAQQASSHAAQVAEAWFAYRAALQVEQLLDQNFNTMSTALGTVAVLSANENQPADISGEREKVFRTRARLDRARLDAVTERARLASLLGIAGWRDDWQLAGDLPALPEADPQAATIEAAALTRRFDLLAAQKAVDMRLRQLSTRRRFRWLSELEIGVFRDKALGGTPFTGPNVAVELPLFDQRQAALLQADAELRGSVLQLEMTALEARRQIRTHSETLATMRRLVELYARDILPIHQRAAADLGPGDPAALDRLNRRLLMQEVQLEQVAVLRDYWVARSALAQAAGDWLALSGLQ
jgi:cobalt-zinc-cadmium efflux system outer membrane protein